MMERQLTKREERLAKALEGLSARDMKRFVDNIANDYMDSNKYQLQARLLTFASRATQTQRKS